MGKKVTCSTVRSFTVRLEPDSEVTRMEKSLRRDEWEGNVFGTDESNVKSSEEKRA
jgi:hypothetical protein